MKGATAAKPIAGKKATSKTKRLAKSALPDTFTVRDMSRDTATVFAASREHGKVIIRSRTGERYVVMPENGTDVKVTKRDDPMEKLYELHTKLIEMGCKPGTPEEEASMDRIIAGEE